jgi:glycine C-acetyltransferase
MLGDAERAQRMAAALLDEGVHAVAFFYPVVPEGRARIRTQMNAAFTQEDLELARTAFKRAAERCRG